MENKEKTKLKVKIYERTETFLEYAKKILRQLGYNYIILYYIHYTRPNTKIRENWGKKNPKTTSISTSYYNSQDNIFNV